MRELAAQVVYVDAARAAVVLPPPGDRDIDKAAELRLLTYWACNYLADQGQDYYGEVVANEISQRGWGDDTELRDWLSSSQAWDSAAWGDRSIGVVEVAAASGKAQRRVRTRMTYADRLQPFFFELERPHGGDWKLKIERLFFGGKSAWPQFAGSVFVLLHELLARRIDDADYRRRMLATLRAIGFAWSVGQLKPGLPWRRGAAEAAAFGWFGIRPRFPDADPLPAFRVKSLRDSLWLERLGENGYLFVWDIPDEQLPFVTSEDSFDELDV